MVSAAIGGPADPLYLGRTLRWAMWVVCALFAVVTFMLLVSVFLAAFSVCHGCPQRARHRPTQPRHKRPIRHCPSKETVLALMLAGSLMSACFLWMCLLGDQRQHTLSFLALNSAAWVGYGVSIRWMLRRSTDYAYRSRVILAVLGFAVLFRVALLTTTPPTLSDDVYRYIWDGRVSNAGTSPYAHAVDSPDLDWLGSPLRHKVNHAWMASPYLPTAQALFWVVYRLAPDRPLAFRMASVLFDLLTACMIMDMLRRLGLDREHVLLYLWNPLIVVEFAHGGHVDSLMIYLIIVALWALIALRSRTLSVLALAAATLTKGIPLLLLPLLVPRWGWRSAMLYVVLVGAICILFALGPGLGLGGPMDGEGLFGAIRIYGAEWDYNSSVFGVLRLAFSSLGEGGSSTARSGDMGTRAAKLVVLVCLAVVEFVVWRASRGATGDRTLLRLTVVPFLAYLLLTTTVHPWYVTLIAPLLPFLASGPRAFPQARGPMAGERDGEQGAAPWGGRLLVPLLWFSAVVPISYLTYLDPAGFRDFAAVRLVEYVPLFVLLLWAVWPAIGGAVGLGRGRARPHRRNLRRT